MKNFIKTGLMLAVLIGMFNAANAQFGDLKDKLIKLGASQGAKTLGIEKWLKQPEAISTSFADVDLSDKQMPDFKANEKAQPLYLLPKAPEGGFFLCAGLFEMTSKSYCLKAGTFAPSKGDGYMYAPTLGPKTDIVVAILKSAEKHPDIEQNDIQMLLWAIIARTKFADYMGQVKVVAIKLLSTKQLTQLEGGVLGVLPIDVVAKAKDKLPNDLKAVFEAENNIRQLVASGNYTFAEMEKYAIIAGMAPVREDVPSGVWTKHPDGYFVRYFPSSYSKTKVQVYVPKELVANGARIIYDATNDIACPANTGSQRLAQTNEPLNANYQLKLITPCN